VERLVALKSSNRRISGGRVTDWSSRLYLSGRIRFENRYGRDNDRGDVSGWVLVTLMTAGLVLTLWAAAGPRLEGVFDDAMDRVVGGP
jgi:hypothetical protein